MAECEIELFEDDEHDGDVRWWRKYAADGEFIAMIALCDHHHAAQEEDLSADLRPEPLAAPCMSQEKKT